MTASSPSTEIGGQSAVVQPFSSASFSQLLLLLDWYPGAHGGFHVQGGVGLGQYTLRPNTNFATSTDTRTLSGFAWHLGGGWEGWVGEQWAIGGLLRIDGASVKDDTSFGSSVEGSVLSPKLLFSVTFNLAALTERPCRRTVEG